jgi:hypothetical protein
MPGAFFRIGIEAMIKGVVLRTHGGLGNQLFQILFGRLHSELLGATLFELHDDRYRHKFARTTEVTKAQRPGVLQRAVSDTRFPKLVERLLHQPNRALGLMGYSYADGYFQHSSCFAPFDQSKIRWQLERFAEELRVGRPGIRSKLFHIRLGDFFSAEVQSLNHALDRLSAMPEGSYLMTNDEGVFTHPQVAGLMRQKSIRLVETEGLSSEEVIRQMAQFEEIETNNSTLALWAAVLSGSKLTLSSEKLTDCYDLFRAALLPA